MRLKIMEYNVLDGFHNHSGIFEEKRLESARKIVREYDPDILVITEARFPAEEVICTEVDYQKEFGIPNLFHGAIGRGRKHAALIMSKHPFILAENYSMDRRKFVRGIINCNNRLVTIDAVHPHPLLNEQEKEQFFKNVLRDRRKPYILAGDFNSWSPRQNRNKEGILEVFKQFNDFKGKPQEAEKAVNDMLTCKAMKRVRSFDLTDTYEAINKEEDHTIPTDLLSKDKRAAERLDYIFCSRDFRVVKAGIIKNDLAEIASDHYPIYAELELG